MASSEHLRKLKNLVKEAYHYGLEPVVVELLPLYLAQQAEDGYAWFMYGDSLRIIGRASEALVALKNSLELAPTDHLSDVHIRLGSTCSQRGKFEEAEQWYAMAAEGYADSERGWLWIERGINFAKLEKFEEAAQHYSRALEFDSYQDEAYLNLGYAFRAMGKYAEATDALEKALSITPDYPEAREALDSLEDIQEDLAFANQNEDSEELFYYGNALRVVGRTSEALVALKKSLDLVSADSMPDVHILLGKTCIDGGRFEEAEQWYALAAEGDSGSKRACLWIFRGVNYARMEQFEEATQCYSHAIELDYNRDEAYLNLGYVFRAMGKYAKAIDVLEKALSLTPDYPEAREALDSLDGIQEAVAFANI